jgi:hypothetical protein
MKASSSELRAYIAHAPFHLQRCVHEVRTDLAANLECAALSGYVIELWAGLGVHSNGRWQRRLERQLRVREQLAHGAALDDQTQQPQTPTALRTCQHVQSETAPHQLGPLPA